MKLSFIKYTIHLISQMGIVRLLRAKCLIKTFYQRELTYSLNFIAYIKNKHNYFNTRSLLLNNNLR